MVGEVSGHESQDDAYDAYVRRRLAPVIEDLVADLRDPRAAGGKAAEHHVDTRARDG